MRRPQRRTSYTDVSTLFMCEETKDTLLDYKKLIDGYIGTEKDWRVKENSTVTLSVGGLILSNSGAVTANYWLSEVYDEDVADAHRNCFMHIHDLSMLTGYCAGWSLKQLIQEGLGGVPDRNYICASKASYNTLQSDGKLPRNHAERMGRSSGLLII